MFASCTSAFMGINSRWYLFIPFVLQPAYNLLDLGVHVFLFVNFHIYPADISGVLRPKKQINMKNQHEAWCDAEPIVRRMLYDYSAKHDAAL